MIDQELANRMAAAFRFSSKGSWPGLRTEIQGDFSYLLLEIDVKPADAVLVRSLDRCGIADALNKLMPITAKNPTGNWIVCFKRDGVVYDSILAIDRA